MVGLRLLSLFTRATAAPPASTSDADALLSSSSSPSSPSSLLSLPTSPTASLLLQSALASATKPPLGRQSSAAWRVDLDGDPGANDGDGDDGDPGDGHSPADPAVAVAGVTTTLPVPPPAHGDATFRLRVLVGGAGGSGKTSLIRALTEATAPASSSSASSWSAPSAATTSTTTPFASEMMETPETPLAFGVDFYDWQFTHANLEGHCEHHRVAFCDFTGVDGFECPQGLLLSAPRPLYLLCVDLEQYAAKLGLSVSITRRRSGSTSNVVVSRRRLSSTMSSTSTTSLDPEGEDRDMDVFVFETIFRALRFVFQRRPDVELVLVGTKADAIHRNVQAIEMIQEDLSRRLRQFQQLFVAGLDDEIANIDILGRKHHHHPAAHDHHNDKNNSKAKVVRQLIFLKENSVNLIPRRWLLVGLGAGAKHPDPIELRALRLELQGIIRESPSRLPLRTELLRASDVIRRLRDQARAQRLDDRIQSSFLSARDLLERFSSEIPEITDDAQARTLLHELHTVGDVVWFDKFDDIDDSDLVMIDPRLLVRFACEVLSHTPPPGPQGPLSITAIRLDEEDLRREGLLRHRLLAYFPLWEHVSDPMVMLRMKKLLRHFHLAFPASETAELTATSDLIVPAYWRLGGQSRFLVSAFSFSGDGLNSLTRLCWEYFIKSGIPEDMFEAMAIHSHMSGEERIVGDRSVQRVPSGDLSSRIQLCRDLDISIEPSIIQIEVASESADEAWAYFRSTCCAMEEVLDRHPGVSVQRYVLDECDERHPLERLLRRPESDEARGLLPFDMSWYRDKIWRPRASVVDRSSSDKVVTTTTTTPEGDDALVPHRVGSSTATVPSEHSKGEDTSLSGCEDIAAVNSEELDLGEYIALAESIEEEDVDLASANESNSAMPTETLGIPTAIMEEMLSTPVVEVDESMPLARILGDTPSDEDSYEKQGTLPEEEILDSPEQSMDEPNALTLDNNLVGDLLEAAAGDEPKQVGDDDSSNQVEDSNSSSDTEHRHQLHHATDTPPLDVVGAPDVVCVNEPGELVASDAEDVAIARMEDGLCDEAPPCPVQLGDEDPQSQADVPLTPPEVPVAVFNDAVVRHEGEPSSPPATNESNDDQALISSTTSGGSLLEDSESELSGQALRVPSATHPHADPAEEDHSSTDSAVSQEDAAPHSPDAHHAQSHTQEQHPVIGEDRAVVQHWKPTTPLTGSPPPVLRLTILHAAGLAERDWWHTWCKWELGRGSGSTRRILVSGKTGRNSNKDTEPSWLKQSFALGPLPASILRDCTLFVELHRPRHVPLKKPKLLGTGSVKLAPFVHAEAEKKFRCGTIEVKLNEYSPASVTCQIYTVTALGG